MKRAVRAFLRFWWEFLIGDTPELFVGVLVLSGTAWVLRHEPVAAAILLPLGVVALLTVSALIPARA